MSVWEDIVKFYKEKFGLKEEYVNFVADREILLACLSGLSNSHIAEIMNLDEEAISITIQYYFGFPGFEEDLDINPYMVYNWLWGNGLKDNNLSKKDFNMEIKRLSEQLKFLDVDIYSCCKKLRKLEEKVKEKWK